MAHVFAEYFNVPVQGAGTGISFTDKGDPIITGVWRPLRGLLWSAIGSMDSQSAADGNTHAPQPSALLASARQNSKGKVNFTILLTPLSV